MCAFIIGKPGLDSDLASFDIIQGIFARKRPESGQCASDYTSSEVQTLFLNELTIGSLHVRSAMSSL